MPRRKLGGGILDMIQGAPSAPKEQGKPRAQCKHSEQPKQRTRPQAYRLSEDLIQKVRDVAWWDRRTVADVVESALSIYIERAEKARGEPYPKREGERRGRLAG